MSDQTYQFKRRTHWRGFRIGWCPMCECASMVCDDCQNGSCSGGGCRKCLAVYEDWKKARETISKEELEVLDDERQLLEEIFGA